MNGTNPMVVMCYLRFDKGQRLSGPHLLVLSSCLTNRVVGFSLVQVIDNRSSAQWLGGI
jgi:hypothetical protein